MWFNLEATHDIENRLKSKTLSIWTESGEKPVVHFQGAATFMEYSDTVQYARIFALDHPAYGRDWIRTSPIVKIHDNGDIETQNTIYRPVDKMEEKE